MRGWGLLGPGWKCGSVQSNPGKGGPTVRAKMRKRHQFLRELVRRLLPGATKPEAHLFLTLLFPSCKQCKSQRAAWITQVRAEARQDSVQR